MIADESFPDRPDLRIVPPDGGLARPLQAQHGWTVDAGGMPRQAVQAKIDMFFVRQDRSPAPTWRAPSAQHRHNLHGDTSHRELLRGILLGSPHRLRRRHRRCRLSTLSLHDCPAGCPTVGTV
jgi:hypothetical protein